MPSYTKFLIPVIAFLYTPSSTATPPRAVIIIVGDQLAYSYLEKLSPFLKGGIHTLQKQGIVYKNAYHPHALPATCTGHAGISTGTFAQDHGIIDNAWFDGHGKKISCDDGSAKNAVFSPDGLYVQAKSAENLMVDTINDQLILFMQPGKSITSVSLSLKSRAAIMMAGKLGKAVWFDELSGNFTSSKAYFNQLPPWLTDFNKEHHINKIKTVTWKPVFEMNNPAYAQTINNYTHASSKPLFGQKLQISYDDHEPYAIIEKMPLGSKLLFDLGLTCIDTFLTKEPTNTLVLWISVSNIDYIGHTFGPQSIEYADIVYHVDRQLKNFMNKVYNKVGRENVLFVLTADHGIQALPEITHQQGYPAERLLIDDTTITQMNNLISEQFGITHLVVAFQPTQFYLDEDLFKQLNKKTQRAVLEALKNFVRQLPGIKTVWDYQELAHADVDSHSLESYYKKQLYPERSGHIIFQAQPYIMPTNYKNGTSHISPYESDTHVPLIFYQWGKHQKKTIERKVWAEQIAPTLAEIFDVPKPSATTLPALPGIVVDGD